MSQIMECIRCAEEYDVTHEDASLHVCPSCAATGYSDSECIDCGGLAIEGPDDEGFMDCFDCGAAWIPRAAAAPEGTEHASRVAAWRWAQAAWEAVGDGGPSDGFWAQPLEERRMWLPTAENLSSSGLPTGGAQEN